MSPPQQSRAQRHEIGNRVLSIANEFLENAGDKAESFAAIKSYTARKSSLGEETGLGDDQLIYLLCGEMLEGLAVLEGTVRMLVIWTCLHTSLGTNCMIVDG